MVELEGSDLLCSPHHLTLKGLSNNIVFALMHTCHAIVHAQLSSNYLNSYKENVLKFIIRMEQKPNGVQIFPQRTAVEIHIFQDPQSEGYHCVIKISPETILCQNTSIKGQ